MTLSAEDRKFILDEFKSTVCQCGFSKDSRKSFCYTCYKKLPNDMQKNLWKKFSMGYEEAYEEALTFLVT